ncbi:hypothetical protein HDEF_1165 [Candidatus Hamiltonella defensa 5AT (Acyrthosiphon pisum)]|uniref:Uncharacterized protein n=1 Tax=Hamiltonella defensa subsp. Acyrthosiphon pisum (strain 5AT) TaxID=572265 RepID=C4K5I5_HAMD5|nr:hypothetical protein HDEF_1165 [Candidatus Hamiltonella defensa 5AT (Acyrthosiphon pisum)]
MMTNQYKKSTKHGMTRTALGAQNRLGRGLKIE